MKIRLAVKHKQDQLAAALKHAGFELSDDADYMITENDHLTNLIHETKPLQHLSLEHIAFIEAYGRDVFAYDIKRDCQYALKETLYQLEDRYATKGFIRVNKSQIVNIRHINKITPGLGQKLFLTLSNQMIIDVNRTYYKAFKAYLNM